MNCTVAFTIKPDNILCIRAVSITDKEASGMINNIAKINTWASHTDIRLTERSNLAFVPVSLHKYIPIAKCSIKTLETVSTVTDVHVAVLALRESIDTDRSLYTLLERLHAVLSTPADLDDAMSLFSRRLCIESFKKNAFRFITT
jgi:hypothetical protein